jgi:ribosome modulation factor
VAGFNKILTLLKKYFIHHINPIQLKGGPLMNECYYCGGLNGKHTATCPVGDEEALKFWGQGLKEGRDGVSPTLPNNPVFLRGWRRGIQEREAVIGSLLLPSL